MAQVCEHNVYTKVSIEECIKEAGRNSISVGWLDINKGDEDNLEYRSRLVAQELKKDKREDLFAAAPPLEAKRLLFSMAVAESIGYESGKPEEGI